MMSIGRPGAEVDDVVGPGAHDEQQQRDDERQEQLLAVAGQQPQLHRGLRAQHRRCVAAARAGREVERSHRSALPVSSRNRSSRVCRSTSTDSASTPWPAHQAVRVASSAGSTCAGDDVVRRAASRRPWCRGGARASGPRRRAPARAVKRTVFLAPDADSSAGVPEAMTRAGVDDVHLVGQRLGLVHEVRRQHRRDAAGAQLVR